MTAWRRGALAASLLPLVVLVVPHAGRAGRVDTITSSSTTSAVAARARSSFHAAAAAGTRPAAARAPSVTTAPAVTAPPPAPPAPAPTPPDMAGWERVAQCETGGDWSMRGPIYSGGIGMTNANWTAYGGLAFAPTAGEATPAEQVTIAERVERTPPATDQPPYCEGW